MKTLGKITRCQYGNIGYQDVMLGIGFTISSNGWCVDDFWGYWGADVPWSSGCQWTEQERIENLGKTSMRISELLKSANVKTIDKLVGIPVEVTTEGGALKSWRILEEVL